MTLNGKRAREVRVRRFDDVRDWSRFKTAVSLHAHTFHSREAMTHLPRYITRIPMLAGCFEREQRTYLEREGYSIDFSKGWWQPPVSPREVFESEARQIEDRFELESFASLTDHDDISAGLDPDRPPRTWPEVESYSKKLQAAGVPCGFTTGWQTWVQLENFSAWHNVPFATRENGFGGLDAELVFNSPLHIYKKMSIGRHLDSLAGGGLRGGQGAHRWRVRAAPRFKVKTSRVASSTSSSAANRSSSVCDIDTAPLLILIIALTAMRICPAAADG